MLIIGTPRDASGRMYVVIQTAYKPFYAALLLSDIQQIHVHDNSYLSELPLFLLHQQGMFHLSRVVGHLEVTFEYLFTPVLMFRQSVF